ncbi:MAG: FHA domain-containing protein, partial [Anaerolineales bacterium]|nr:FHA domain-containing protein [Anaerolineales bacterium]
MKIKLDQLENRLQSLIEIHLVDYFLGSKMKEKIAHQLTRAVQSNILIMPDNSIIAPDTYILTGHPAMIEKWVGNQTIPDTIGQVLDAIRVEMGIIFSTKPTISIVKNMNLAQDEIRIIASHKCKVVVETKANPSMPDYEDNMSNLPINAFLIVNGTTVLHLDQSVINIGRRKDNHLNIDDPRISRNHAQLRAIKGRYILFDLNSTGGTCVNGERISQSTLQPG